MPSLTATNLTRHFDAATNADLYKNLSGGLLVNNPADGEAPLYWDDKIDTATDSSRVILLATGGTPSMVWHDDNVMNFPSVEVLDGVWSLKTQGGAGLNYAPPSSTSFVILLSFYIDSTGTYPNSATSYFNCCLVGGARNTYSGVYIRKNGGTYTLYPYNWDGNEDGSTIGITVTPDVPHTLCLRHDGGTLYFSVDCGAESSVASGATTNQTAFFLGDEGVNSGTTADFRGRFGELAIYTPSITGQELADAKQYFCDKWLLGLLDHRQCVLVCGENGTVSSSWTTLINNDAVTRTVNAPNSLYVGCYMYMHKQGTAPTPITDTVVLWVRDNGSGKMQLMAQGPTGAASALFTEP